MDTFGLSKYFSIINPRESKFINHLNGDKEFQTNKGSLTTCPDYGAGCNRQRGICNTHKVFVLGNIQSVGVEIQSEKIRTLILNLAQELRTTFGKMPNKVVVTSE